MQYFELVSFFLKTICVKLEACVCVSMGTHIP